jgi:hypothetical protein
MSNLRLTIGSSFDDEEVVLEPNTIEPAIDEGAKAAISNGMASGHTIPAGSFP